MKMRWVMIAVIAALSIGWWSGVGFTEDKPAEPAKPMSEAEMMPVMMQWAQPSEHHAALKPFVGTWDVKGAIYSSMGELEITGVSTTKLILGGRFLETTYKGPFMGGEFEGRALFGYDNGRKKYTSCWIMTMATAQDWATGTYDADTKTFTMMHNTFLPDGKEHPQKTVTVLESESKYTETAYAKGPDGAWKKTRMMVSTKRAAK